MGQGVVAVDPSVIPLGTKLYIPGYGNGVAADVGGGIKGDIIDLWYSTSASARLGAAHRHDHDLLDPSEELRSSDGLTELRRGRARSSALRA